MSKAFVIIFFFLFFQSCENKKKSFLNNKVVIYDIAYGESPKNKLNAFLPANRDNNTKAVILIHGGAWVARDKQDFDYIASVFADSSVAAFTINYRYANISNNITYVEMLDDIDKAIKFLVSKSNKFVFDSQHICLFGHSAGGHLALLYTYRNNNLSYIEKVVSVAGPTDFTDSLLVNSKEDKDLLNIVVGSTYINKIEDASPFYHSNAITTYLYHGKSDTIVPYQQSEKLFKKIKSDNVNNRYVLFENDNHGVNYSNWMRVVNETLVLINSN